MYQLIVPNYNYNAAPPSPYPLPNTSPQIIKQYSSLTVTGGSLTSTISYVKTEQEYSSIDIWQPAVSIVFIARNLNVVKTLEAKPFVFGYDPQRTGNNANVSNILFEVPFRQSKPTISYQATSEYILTNLLGIVETGELQIDVFWKDTFGSLNILYLDVGSTFLMSLLFRKKIFNY